MSLQKDHAEDGVVYQCLLELLKARNPKLLALLPAVLSVFARSIPDESQVAGDIRAALVRSSALLWCVASAACVAHVWLACRAAVVCDVQAGAVVELARESPTAVQAAVSQIREDALRAVLAQVLAM
jgi:hypothetical protein